MGGKGGKKKEETVHAALDLVDRQGSYLGVEKHNGWEKRV